MQWAHQKDSFKGFVWRGGAQAGVLLLLLGGMLALAQWDDWTRYEWILDDFVLYLLGITSKFKINPAIFYGLNLDSLYGRTDTRFII